MDVMEEGQKESAIKLPKIVKRMHDDKAIDVSGISQEEKKRKTDENENGQESSSSSTNRSDSDDDDIPLQLNTINTHCMQHIFEYLSLHDQIKMAELDGKFVFGAAEAFSRRYRVHRIEVYLSVYNNYSTMFYSRNLRIHGTVAMAGLQHFGARMLTLSANFCGFRSCKPEERYPIDLAILKNCSASLKTLQITACVETHFEMIEKPFKKIEKLTVNDSTLGTAFGQLNKWFPNVINLTLSLVKFVQPSTIETRFEHLTTLNIMNDQDAQMSEQTICKLLRFNVQLKSLKLQSNFGTDTLLAMAKSLQSLESLELWMPTDRFASYTAEQKVSWKMLKKFILHSSSKLAVFDKMPFVLENVNELRLYGFYQYHPFIAELIASGESLKTLIMVPTKPYTLPFPATHDYDALQHAISTRQHLNELELCVDEFIGDDLMWFIDKCKNLNVVRMLTSNYSSFSPTSQLRTDRWLVLEPGVKMSYIDLGIASATVELEFFYELTIKRIK